MGNKNIVIEITLHKGEHEATICSAWRSWKDYHEQSPKLLERVADILIEKSNEIDMCDVCEGHSVRNEAFSWCKECSDKITKLMENR